MAEHGRAECVTEYSEKIPEFVAGLSNSQGGRILVGIDDNGSIVGLEDRIETALMCVHAMRDKGRTGFKDRMEISGSVLRQYDDVMNFIRRNVRMSSEISGTQRVDSADYTMEAVREIVLNAIIHRDYRSTGSTLVSMYDDCMEAASPGSLPEDIPVSGLLRGSSFPRNRMLAGIFYRLGLVESYGSGIPRVMSIYRDNAMKPELTISAAMFRVTLYPLDRRGDDDKSGWVTRSDIEKDLGVSKSTAANIIKEKLARGELVKDGRGKSTRYRIVARQA